MKTARSLLLAVLSLAWARPCLAGAGAEPFDFLFLDAGARAVGLGGAYTALAKDASALLYNPAGLARVARHEATFMHNAYLQGISQEYAAYAGPHGWGASLNYLRFGDVQRTTLSNPEGQGLGQTTLNDLAFGGGYGLSVLDSVALGVGGKYIREVIDGSAMTGIALDAGALYSVPLCLGLDVGLALQNIGPTTRSPGAHENLPLNLRAGAAYTFYVQGQESVIALDLSKERSQGPLAAVGGETRIKELLAFRLGFNTRNEAGLGLTAGFGFLFDAGSIDYAFVPMGDLGDAHRFSATLRWDADFLRRPRRLRDPR